MNDMEDIHNELSEFQYDEELFNRIKKDGIQEFSLIELELIDLTYRVTNAPLYIVDNDERYNYLIQHLTDIKEVVTNKLKHLSERELKYAKTASALIITQLLFFNDIRDIGNNNNIKDNVSFLHGLPNDIEGFGECFWVNMSE